MSVVLTVLRWGAVVLLVLFLCVWLAVGKLYLRAHAALPQTEGEIAAPGLDAAVSMVRDERGIPHIFAETDHDAAFALGFAHAQDRLWQMHVTRWFLRGEIAGVLGALAADSDAQMRVYGLAEAADALAGDLTAAERAPLQAYADGVNAAMDSRGFVPPLEFLMLAVPPEPWTVEDALLVYKGLAFDLLNGDFQRAYGVDAITAMIGEERIAEFLPAYPADGPVTLSADDLGLAPAGAPPEPGEPSDPDSAPRDGSNAWVVSGEHTVTGAPLLANDPHLGLRAPGVWYLAAIHRPAGAVVGATVPGAPEVVIGRNESIAWGMTITGTDVADLVFSPESAVTEDRTETIRVRFGQERTVRVRRTADGPVLLASLFRQAGLAPEGQLAVVRWPLDDPADRTVTAGAPLSRAGDWGAFNDALTDYYAPMVNILFGATDGDIGLVSPGFVPVRDEDGNWTGRVPFDELPRVRNPQSGVIVNANNPVVPPDYPHFITENWAEPYRAQRIVDLLAETPVHSPDSFAAIQTDTVDLAARNALPVLLQAEPETDPGRRAQELMQGWDGDMAADSAPALVYAAWMKAMARAVYSDEFGEDFLRVEADRPQFMDSVLAEPAGAWCDDAGTPDMAETCVQIAGPALDDAAAELRAAYGSDMADWRWGAAHRAYFPHAPFSAFPVLDGVFSAWVEAPGAGETINESGFGYGPDAFEAFHGPSLRAIYDFSDLDASRFSMPLGQSGHVASPHYTDLLEPWARGEYFEIRTDWTPDSIPNGASHLRLVPEN